MKKQYQLEVVLGVEEYMSRINGVVDTKVGYANGHTENPTYEEVCTNTTGHAEAVYIKFDENIIPLEELLNRFWKIINPPYLIDKVQIQEANIELEYIIQMKRFRNNK